MAGKAWVLVGPSGTGKTSLAKDLPGRITGLRRAITCTTRPRRPGEVEGVDYRYVSDERFDEMLRNDELIEWTSYGGARYGLPADQFKDLEDHDLLCVLDLAGVHHLRERLDPSRVRAVFLEPPPAADLEQRMRGRGSSPAEIERRLATITAELAGAEACDYRVSTGAPYEQVLLELERLIQGNRTAVL